MNETYLPVYRVCEVLYNSLFFPFNYFCLLLLFHCVPTAFQIRHFTLTFTGPLLQYAIMLVEK